MPQLLVDGQDISGAAHYDVSVDVGRDSVDVQPDACVLNATVEGWVPAGTVHALVQLRDDYGQLFSGRTTDLSAELNADRGVWETRLTAVSQLGDLGRVYVGDEPWPEETDSQRVARILELAGAGDVSQIDPDTPGPLILAKDVDRQPALKLCQSVAQSAYGVFWEQPADEVAPVRYTPQSLRSWSSFVISWQQLPDDLTWEQIPPAITWETFGSGAWNPEQVSMDLDARYVLASVALEQRIADLARKVRITYGPALKDPEGADIPRPQVIAGDQPPELARETELSQEVDAARLADTLWRSRREPSWQMRAITLRPLEALPDGIASMVRRSLAIGSRVTLQDIGFSSPVGSQWQGYLEGWSHRIQDYSHTIVLYLSQRSMTEPADRWMDLDPLMAWQDIPPGATWDQAGWH